MLRNLPRLPISSQPRNEHLHGGSKKPHQRVQRSVPSHCCLTGAEDDKRSLPQGMHGEDVIFRKQGGLAVVTNKHKSRLSQSPNSVSRIEKMVGVRKKLRQARRRWRLAIATASDSRRSSAAMSSARPAASRSRITQTSPGLGASQSCFRTCCREEIGSAMIVTSCSTLLLILATQGALLRECAGLRDHRIGISCRLLINAR